MFWSLIGCLGGAEAEPLLFPIEAPCDRIGATMAEVLAAEGVYSPGDTSVETTIGFTRERNEAELTVTHGGLHDDSVAARQVVYELSVRGAGELRVTTCRTSLACARSVLPPCS